MDANQYIGFYYGNKEEAIKQLEKSISLYENSKLTPTPKVTKRIQDYKNLLAEIKSI